MSLVKVENLDIGYDLPIQKNLNFTLNEGEILCIKGKNGSGKSTLIKTLWGDIPSINGKVTWAMPNDQISILPQVVAHEFPLSISLGEILDIFEPNKEARKFLPSSLMERRFNDASGGERQKTLILSRLSDETQFLILDEPFNHLDKEACLEMAQFIENLITQKVIRGIILISHIDVEFNAELLKSKRVKEVLLS